MPRIEVWTVNLGRHVGPAAFRRAVRSVLAEADEERAAICFQEIDEADKPDEHGILEEEAAADYDAAAWDTAVPILLSRRRFKKTGEKVTFASKGLAGVTPHRVIAEGHTRLRSRFSGQPRTDFPVITFLDTHAPVNRKTTRLRRLQVRAVLTYRARKNMKWGRIVIYALDSNARFWPRLVPGDFRIIQGGPGNIDRAGIILPPNIEMKIVQRKRVDLHIDKHDALGVVLDLFLKGGLGT